MLDTEFFNEAFGNNIVPGKIRSTAEFICREFNIRGICDPMFISNVIAVELGIGDGQGNFYDNDPQHGHVHILADRLYFSYGTCIRESGSDLDLEKLILERIFTE